MTHCEGTRVSEKPKYAEIRQREREELDAAFKSSDANVICNALYSAAQHEADWRWSQDQCLKMLNHESLLVRSTALIALGEIALFRGRLDLGIVLPQIQRSANDPALAPFAQDALDNIRAAKLRQ
jgi:HEAT repeat protein